MKRTNSYNYISAMLLLSAAHCVFADGSGEDVVYNNGWPNNNAGSFGINQNNIFTSSGAGTPALTVKAGVASLNVNTAGTYTNRFGSPGNSHTNIKIEGGWLNMNNDGSGDLTNDITGNIDVSEDGKLYMFNSRAGGLTNTIKGNVSVSDGAIYMINTGSGTSKTTMENLSITGGTVFMGGAESTTTINHALTMGGGDLAFYHHGDADFGTNNAATLNVTAPSTISIVNSAGLDEQHPKNVVYQLEGSAIMGPVTLMHFANPIDISDLSLLNKSPFIETTGLLVSGDGKDLQIGAIPVATADDSADLITLVDGTTNIVQNVGNAAEQAETNFKTTRYQQQRNQRALRYLLQQRGARPLDKLSNVMMHLAQNQDSVIVSKFKGNYRVWLTPYFHAVNSKGNRAATSGFKECYYGIMFGGSHYLKNLDLNIRATLGLGLSNRQNKRHQLNNSNGKHAILGLSGVKNYIKGGEITSSLYGMYATKNQSRFAQPDPNQQYLAKASVSSFGLSWMNEINYVHKLDDQNSIRPSLGLYLGWSRRAGFSETNIPTLYAQKYKASIDKNGEIYTGLGYRHKFSATDAVESKITGTYEIGYKSGNGRSTSSFSTVAQPNVEAIVRGKNAGRVTHYLNLYGSVLNKKNNWKLAPGITAVLQAKQTSITGTLKAEYRF